MEEYVYIDSAMRDTTLWPNSNAYSMYISNPLKNIFKVDLVSATVFSPPAPLLSNVVCLDIEELRTQKFNVGGKLIPVTSNINGIRSNTITYNLNYTNHAFGIIPTDNTASTVFKYFKENADYKISHEYPHVIEKLTRLTVNWRDVTGNLVAFNNLNNSFMLRIHRTNVPPNMERPKSLPAPVPLMAKPQINMIVYGVLVIGLLTIILMKK